MLLPPPEGSAMTQPNYVTREGLERLQAELTHLRTDRRREVADRIQQSRERGGTVSNAEYEEAINERSFVEGRIQALDNMISNAVLIEEDQGQRESVGVGAKVTVRNPQGKPATYTITGITESDPAQGKISNVSPIGKSLLGKKVGEIAEVSAPSGKIQLEIIAIE
jgi:transcription elongation factor GreA